MGLVMVHRETMWGEVVLDDDGVATFRLSEDSNRDGSHHAREISLAANTFPVGTTISISEPEED
ncbi:MAG: hypothetical protein ACXIVF_15655 [Rhizobiaceae bacterium]